MLQTDMVEIPTPVHSRLQVLAGETRNVRDYALGRLVSFGRPVSASFAIVCPVAVAFTVSSSGIWGGAQIALLMSAMAVLGISIIGTKEWPSILEGFHQVHASKARAEADLAHGFGEASSLMIGRAPAFFQHENGVVVLVDAGDMKTLFFDIPKDTGDPRWSLFESGALNRRVWQWLTLPISCETVRFTTDGATLISRTGVQSIATIDAYEAINQALGDPKDGETIQQPFDVLVNRTNTLL